MCRLQRGAPPSPRLVNGVLAVLHAAQALAILINANAFSLPVRGWFLRGPPGSGDGLWEPVHLFSVRVGAAVGVFLLLAAAEHAAALWNPGKFYEREMDTRVYLSRWLEYSLSATTMMWLILLFCGQDDLGLLLVVSGSTAGMIWCGWEMEARNAGRPLSQSGNGEEPAPVQWSPFYLGCLLGFFPWAVAFYALAGSNAVGRGPPAFVYGIVFSMMALFFSFAVVQWVQFTSIEPGGGRRHLSRADAADRARERYQLLSLTSKSLLAWLIYGQTLALD